MNDAIERQLAASRVVLEYLATAGLDCCALYAELLAATDALEREAARPVVVEDRR